MGRSQETQDTILQYLASLNVPAVIDADAIHAVAKDPSVLAGKPFLLTPNTYEFTLLGGKDVRSMPLEARIEEVKAVALKLGTAILLKAAVDIITDGNEVLLNETGSPYLSIGGAGDTLSGIAGALMARKAGTMNSAAGAAYINGKAGELAAGRWKESLIATDIIDAIPEVINK